MRGGRALSSGMSASQNGRCRIVLTGGPGGGKTTAGDLFRRALSVAALVKARADRFGVKAKLARALTSAATGIAFTFLCETLHHLRTPAFISGFRYTR